LRACAKLGVRLVHSAPSRPQGRGKIERFFRTVREQFLIEVADTSSEDLTAAGVDDATALLELNRLFTAWVEVVLGERGHRAAKRGADVLEDGRRRNLKTQVRGQKRDHRPTRLQTRHIPIEVGAIQTLNIERYMPVEYIV
jgi:transposase InsO family protein